MTQSVEVVQGALLPATALAEDMAGAAKLIRGSKSEATLRVYARDWEIFSAWCDTRQLDPVQVRPDDIAAYVAHMVASGRKPAGISRVVTSIAVALEHAGRTDQPTRTAVVRSVVQGTRRTLGTAQRQARPLTTTEVGRMVASLPANLTGVRDRAILLIGFAGAFRRSELVALNIEDIAVVPAGLEVTIRSSKTDQEGAGEVIPIRRASDPACCPVTAWREWIDQAGLTSGAAFRRIDRHQRIMDRLVPASVKLVLSRAAAAAGVDPERLSPHSMRAGYITTQAQRGASERQISRVSRHKSVPVLRSYIRRATIWEDAALDMGW